MKLAHWPAHAIVALILVVGGLAAVNVWSDLWKDAATAFSTVTGLATVYGVVFAIIEVLYTRGAAELAAAEAKRASDNVSALFELRDVTECLACIESVLGQLQAGQAASSPLISRVVKMYSAQFAAEISDPASPSRGNLNAVEAYIVGLLHRGTADESAHLRGALIRMTSELSAISISIKGKAEP